MKFIKGNRKLYIFFITLLVCAIIFSACSSKQKEEQTNINNAVIDNMELINIIFPEKQFEKQGKYYSAGERENYYIENIIPGSFINKDNDELLVVVRRLSNEASHVGGLYNEKLQWDNENGSFMVLE